MALKSETLQMPPNLSGGCTDKMIDERSDDEDLEDGEIFDDDEDDGETKEKKTDKDLKPEEKKRQLDAVPNKKDSGKTSAGDSSRVQDGSANASAGASNTNSGKNALHSSNTQWKKTVGSTNDENVEKKNKKSKKRKRRRGDEDDSDGEVKSEKKKKVRKSTDISSNDLNSAENDETPLDGDDEDDDEMLFVRGASPQRFLHHSSSKSRHYQDGFQSDGDNDEMDHDFDERDDFMDNDEEMEDCDDDERRPAFDMNLSRLDRGGRRERLPVRGRRRGHGNMNTRKKRDDNEVCVFYMQGKCHKGNDCQFSHEAMPYKKQELCKFYLMDCCNKNDKCLYMHSEFPCKYFHMGLKCYANKTCRFSHGKLTESMRQVFIKTFGPIRSKGEFPGKKGSTGKHVRPMDSGGDFNRPRDGGRRVEGGEVMREKKIPSLFDIKVSIPDEMRKDYNSDSDGEGNHTPMPSPPLGQNQTGQHASDSSRSPPQTDPSPAPPPRRRRKEGREERSSKKSNRQRDRGNDSDDSRQLLMPGGPFSNDTWDDLEQQEDMLKRLRMEYNSLLEDENNSSNNNSSNNDSSGAKSNGSNATFSDIADLSRGNFLQSGLKQQQYDSDGSDSHKYETGGGGSEATISNEVGSQSSNSIDNCNNEMIPSHLPKKQRELFLRIQQQQRQAKASETSCNSRQQTIEGDDDIGSSFNSGEDSECLKLQNNEISSSASTFSDQFNTIKLPDPKPPADDQNWYSSDEEDYQQPTAVGISSSTSGTSPSISTILQNLVRLNSSNEINGSSNTAVVPTAADLQSDNIYSNARLTPPIVDSVSGLSGINAVSAGLSIVDFDVNEVTELLSKVKQHFQAGEKRAQEKRRDPRLRSDVGPSGDNLTDSCARPFAPLNSHNANASDDNAINENHVSTAMQNDDVDLRSNVNANRGVGAGDMDLRNLPFKPAPVHSAATEIDASINSHQPLPYRLIPVVVPKPDYSSIPVNSKVGAADPRLRKSIRLSEETSSSVVSSRDPRHRLIDDINKNKAPPAQHNSDPRQRLRGAPGTPEMNSMRGDEQLPSPMMLPPSLSHVRPAYPVMPGTDPGVICPPVSRMNEDSFAPPSPIMTAPVICRPSDPRQRHSQINLQLPTTRSQATTLFDVLTAMNVNSRQHQQGFLGQTGDPRSRPAGMPNNVFPGSIGRPGDSPYNNGQYGFK